MVGTTIIYEGDLHCGATHDPSGATFATDAPVDNQGRGESFSPTDLVGTALGACIMTVMGIVADRLGVDLAGAEAKVDKEMTAAPPRRIARLTVRIRVPATVSEDQRARLEAAAHSCPVKHSLHPDIEIPVTFEWGVATPQPA